MTERTRTQERTRARFGEAVELLGNGASQARVEVWPGLPGSAGQSGPARPELSAEVRVRQGGAAGLVGVVCCALGVTVLAMVLLHVLGAGRLDPLTSTVSDYIAIPGGTVLLSLSVLGVATATAAAAVAALGIGAYRSCLLFGFGCASLLATIAFPTNVLGTPETSDTIVHRWVAAVFFISLPIAALLTTRRQPDRVVSGLVIVSAVISIAFLTSHVPLVFPSWPSAHGIAVLLPRGLVERILLGVNMALLAALARSPGRAGR